MTIRDSLEVSLVSISKISSYDNTIMDENSRMQMSIKIKSMVGSEICSAAN